ncbi:MAG: precorrin-2 C(20)-methyltransferase [SAR324 cluster bacterium]|nr:precorrin-2 C(20)-methyltransferase [SAR324 cluster bacterium]
MNNWGKLIGVSLGPGDPELLTLKAHKQLQGKGLWTYPIKKKGAESYALNIAQGAGLATPDDAQALTFPMTRDQEKLAHAWAKAATELLPTLKDGRDVYFLVEGDASTYSTFAHLARTVTGLEPSIEIETIAGVTSFNASAARLNEPLALEGDAMAVIPAGYGVEVIKQLISEFDCLVLIKVKPLLDDIINLLESLDLLQYSSFIEKVGAAEERMITDVATLKGEKVNYLSLLIVKNPNRIKGEMIKGCKKKETTHD